MPAESIRPLKRRALAQRKRSGRCATPARILDPVEALEGTALQRDSGQCGLQVTAKQLRGVSGSRGLGHQKVTPVSAESIGPFLVEDPSAWRNFPKVRPPSKPTQKRPTPDLFYGIPVALIAEWCGVAVSTAHAYKSGRLKPGRSVVKLMQLYGERRVLSTEWKGWIVKPDAIVDPEGNETPRHLLRGYA